ncbi:hypothetical protein ACLRDI_16350 [Pseudomonas piscis]|uniref:hypothetical protein n=1 Tax=Pseudomonas piscis TaxID=2614538 RepID=UPI0039A46896
MGAGQDNRVEFSLTTKRMLANRAGNICSHYDCLRNTVAPGANKNKVDGFIGTGVAAHIYAASKNGPRPPIGMTEEQIKDQANGAWMCTYCSDLIDKFRWEYPAKLIQEMKRVREFSQLLTVTQSDASYMVRWMGVRRFDGIVREHLPDLDKGSIVKKVIEVGKKCMEEISPSVRQIPEPPSSFTLKTLPILIQTVGRSEQPLSSTRSVANEYRWATEIATQFNHKLYEAKIYDVRQIDYGQVRISARAPDTRKLASGSLDLPATVMCMYNPISSQSEVFLQALTFGGIKWRIEITGRPNALTIDSEILLGTYFWPKSTRQSSYQILEHEAFERYATLVDRIAEGWDIVGQIGLRAVEAPMNDNLHPGIFEISVTYSQHRLQDLQKACEKVRLAYELAAKWDVEIYLDHLPDPRIDTVDLRRGVHCIMEAHPGRTHVVGNRLWVSDDERRCLVVEYNCGRIKIIDKYVPRL